MSLGTYGFIGLGQMGTPMARHHVRPELLVFDVRAEAMAPLVDMGARATADVAELAASADVISVVVRDDAQVHRVCDAALPAARRGTILAIHSTIRPRTAELLAERGRPRGVHVIDAPITGGVLGAEKGDLAVMAGGDPDAIERCRPYFAPWAGLVIRMGAVGMGSRAKLARAILFYASTVATAEAQRLARAAGVPLAELNAIVRHSDPLNADESLARRAGTEAPVEGSTLGELLAHELAIGEKDLSRVLELARELGVPAPLTELALSQLTDSLALPTAHH
jgi:3-hydroxyisobutyrate dehydrogenase-like beta-hydroxyacid dehydrogenase